MKLYLTESFKRDYKKLPGVVQKLLDKQLLLLIENVRHPSLRIKKMVGYFDILEGRISKGYRFTFQIMMDVYIIRRAGAHSILRKP